MASGPRIGIIGWYGSRNLGDELLLRQTIRNLRAWLPASSIHIYSAEPRHTRELWQGFSVYEIPDTRGFAGIRYPVCSLIGRGFRKSLWLLRNCLPRVEISRSILETDILVVGGGGHFYDVPHSGQMSKWHERLVFFHTLHIPIILYGVGAGPIRNQKNKKLWREILDIACLVSVRDKWSYSLARQKCSESLYLSYDPALSFRPQLDNSPHLAMGLDEEYAVVNFRNLYTDGNDDPDGSNQEAYMTFCAAIVKRLRERGMQVLFVPMHPEQDSEIAHRVNARLEPENWMAVMGHTLDCDRVCSILAGARVAVGTRLHFLILSWLSGTPIVPFLYHPKVESFANEVGLRRVSVGVYKDGWFGDFSADVTEAEQCLDDSLNHAPAYEEYRAKLLPQIRSRHDEAGRAIRKKCLGIESL